MNIHRFSWRVPFLAMIAAAVVTVSFLTLKHLSPGGRQHEPIQAALLRLGHPDFAIREEAKQTVARSGAAALPRTLTLLRAHDTWLRVQVLEALEFCGWTRSRQWSAPYAHECGVEACIVLGPLAKAARPDLLQILKERPAANVAKALAATGPEVIPLLQPALTHWDLEVRTWAMFTVGYAAALERRRYAEPAVTNIDFAPAVAVLLAGVQAEEPRIRQTAAWALGKLGPEARSAMPLLVQALSGTNGRVRAGAAEAMHE